MLKTRVVGKTIIRVFILRVAVNRSEIIYEGVKKIHVGGQNLHQL